MPRNPDDDVRDLAFLEGRLFRLESEQKAIRRIHGQLAEEVEALNQAVRNLREERERGIDPWRENTEVRNQRRAELESLRARARDAADAETELQRVKERFWRQLALLVPGGAALLYALAELVRSLVHH